jgi:DNA-binding beta-propeller fold protein YncE
VSSDGTHVWVANYFGDTVTEMDAATGALVRVITGRR